MQFIWTAFCAVAMVFQTRSLAGLPPGPDCLYVMVFAGTVLVYNYNAATYWRRFGAWFFALGAFACWLELPWPTRIIALAPVLFWALYMGFPGRPGLRDKSWAKPPVVALVWALVTVYLPLDTGQLFSWSGVFIQRFLFIIALALGYDLLDRHADKQQGLRTLAGRLGVQATLRVSYICLAASGFFAFINAALGVYSWRFVPVLLLSLLFSAWLIPWQLRRFGPQQWQKLSIDGLMAVQAVLVAWVR